MLYRYYIKKYNAGIFIGLSEFIESTYGPNSNDGFDIVLRLTGIFEDKLPAPTTKLGEAEYWFTQKGNRKFRKAINKIILYLKNNDIDVEILNMEEDELSKYTVLYEDIYQVALAK